MFLKAKLHKESRNGFKTIIYRRYPVMIFSKNWFSAQKIIKKLDVLLIFEFLCQYICIIRPVLKDLIAELLESVEILTKCWKIFNFFTCDFLFLKISCFIGIIATIDLKHLIFKNKKSHVKKLNSFQNFVNISTDSKTPTIKFFKTGLI